jgi:hypothetical protein
MAPPAFKSPRNSARAASVRRLHPNRSPRDEEQVNASSAALSAIILLCAIATQRHEKRPVVVHIEVKDTGARLWWSPTAATRRSRPGSIVLGVAAALELRVDESTNSSSPGFAKYRSDSDRGRLVPAVHSWPDVGSLYWCRPEPGCVDQERVPAPIMPSHTGPMWPTSRIDLRSSSPR